MKFDATQLAALDLAERSRFYMINGGAGVGKTTIIKELARRLMNRGEEVCLCAPTGKAAARLKEATKLETGTIHRVLHYNGVKYLAGSLDGVSMIVDESTMLSSELLAEIVNRNPRRLILVGDQAQLPPVGKGQPFHDLLHIRPDCVSTLTTCYRATEAVFQAAQRIRAGEWPGNFAESPGERWQVLATGDAEKTHAAILEWVEADVIDFDTDIILCAINGTPDTPCSVNGLNADIVRIVNPRDADEKFKVGDRVINEKNFPEEDVWNGTTGKIVAIDHEGCAWVELDVPIVDQENSTPGNTVYKDKVLFGKDMVKHLRLAYALTVHKSQGSQYRNVLFVALSRDAYANLDRSLIYTGVTRTREKCCVVGEASALRQGISTVRQKNTVLQELRN
jgi:exodeoxyribonuclease V alpha subunit